MPTRLYRWFAILVLASIALPVLDADVTTRYQTEITINPAVAGATKGANWSAPQEMTFRLKGVKGFSSSLGVESIIDFGTKEMTILDASSMRYAKTTSEQFAEELAKAMPQTSAATSAALGTVTPSVSPASLTGRTAVIQGVEAEEREMVVSMDGPAIPNAPAGPAMRMVMQIWAAKTGEATRVPAIRELTAHSLESFANMNPMANFERLMKQFPGLADALEPIVKETQNGTVILRMHIDVFIPAMAAIMKQKAAAGDGAGAGLDEGAPFVQVNQELVELSTEPVPDSAFQIPEGYREASASELVQAVLAKSKAALQP
jgi:hypothetical protein